MIRIKIRLLRIIRLIFRKNRLDFNQLLSVNTTELEKKLST